MNSDSLKIRHRPLLTENRFPSSLETGILAIDSMFRLEEGQSSFIIGDRQTGKTSIAIDTIINQKGKNCICIYNAIGQKASTAAKLVGTLEKSGAMEYTIIVCSTAFRLGIITVYFTIFGNSDCGILLVHKGKDCLIIYDDFGKTCCSLSCTFLCLNDRPVVKLIRGCILSSFAIARAFFPPFR